MQSQKNSLKKIAEGYGYIIVDNEEGNDFFSEKISGYDDYDYDRDSIVMLREAIKIRKPDAIFIWELSRLTRNATKVSKYINELSLIPKIPMYFADYKLWTIDPTTGMIDNDAVMKIQGGAMAVEMERERIKQRTSRGRDAKAEQGYYVGHLKDGYIWVKDDTTGEKVFKVDEERRPTILKIYELYLDKEMSTGEVRDYLNAHIEEYPSPNRYRYMHKTMFKGYKNEYHDRSHNICYREDALWTDLMVSNILRDEWYVGIRRYHNKPYTIEPIVSKERWEACKNRLQTYRMKVGTARQPYMLTGLLYCGICGRKLYAHTDGGYSDMYYCSSADFGKNNKCGLKWIKRQNLDAILDNIVRNRVYEDIQMGERSPFSNFFSVDDTKVKDINEKVQTYKSLMERAEKDIEKSRGQIDFYIQQQGKYFDNELLIERYQKQIDSMQRSIEDNNAKILNYEVEIDKLKKKKRMYASVKSKLTEVSNLQDYVKMKELMNRVIDRIYLYNPDNATTVIEVRYVNGKVDTALYCPNRLHKKYIFLTKDDKKIAPFIKYDKDGKCLSFPGLYLALGNNRMLVFDDNMDESGYDDERIDSGISLGLWDTVENKERFIREATYSGLDEDQAEKVYQGYVDKGEIWHNIDDAKICLERKGFKVFKDKIMVKEFIEIRRNDSLYVYEFKDLLPMTERGEEL